MSDPGHAGIFSSLPCSTRHRHAMNLAWVCIICNSFTWYVNVCSLILFIMTLQEHLTNIRAFYRSHKRMPSYSELMAIAGFRSKNAVYKLVQRMIAEEWQEKDATGKLLPGRSCHALPILGTVTAGFPSRAEEDLADTIDKCFADLTGLRRPLPMSYFKIAERMKKELDAELGFTFSVGLAPNKLVARLRPSGKSRQDSRQSQAGRCTTTWPSSLLRRCGVSGRIPRRFCRSTASGPHSSLSSGRRLG